MSLTRNINLAKAHINDTRHLLAREWLVTNGLGGYASGTISGMVTRRYHGLLTAALSAPHGRVMMLNHLAETLVLPDRRRILIGGGEPGHSEDGASGHYVSEFRLENGLPTWRFEAEGFVLEKRVLLIHAQNTTHVSYRLLSGQDCAWVDLRPSVHFRPHENSVGDPLQDDYVLTIHGDRYEIAGGVYPPLRVCVHSPNASFTHRGGRLSEIGYQAEADRGYHSRGLLWSPGHFSVEIRPSHPATLVGSTEDWQTILALEPDAALASDIERRSRLIEMANPSAREGAAAELVLAADQFIITPAGRVEHAARAKAAGDEVRTVIAGYHWFTDWGRDTMISLEGLTLTTGRHLEAGWILRTFAQYVRDGLIPNLFPEGENEGLYHTADASLWFFHAVDRYLETTGDRRTLQVILPQLIQIADAHLRGTHFGIGVDSKDGLLRQGAEGYQLTWMDAKVDGWVVTPRRGKAVEINGLWYNALRLLETWMREENGDEAAAPYTEAANRMRASVQCAVLVRRARLSLRCGRRRARR
jgi:predicted glycogen debranching enzyme